MTLQEALDIAQARIHIPEHQVAADPNTATYVLNRTIDACKVLAAHVITDKT